MDQSSNIYVPFRIRIEAGGTNFTIRLPRKKLEEGYHFYFDSLFLMPELYSKQAQVLGYDSLIEQDFPYTYPFQLEYTYGPEYYPTEKLANKWIQDPKLHGDVDRTLKAINTYFDGAKPAGSVYSPIIFDWCFKAALEDEVDPNVFNATAIEVAYDREDDAPELHGWLPPGSKMPGVNDWVFPTTMSDPLVQASTYIRMHLAPNVEIGFSNEVLLTTFGFTTNQYKPKESPNAQIKFFNPDPCNYLIITAEKPLGPIIPSISNKITLYTYQKKTRSCVGHLTTKRGHLVKPNKLAEDYTRGLKELAKRCNQTLELEYKTETKTFAFKYPINPNIKVEVLVPPDVSEQLGFPSFTTRIPQTMLASPVKVEKDIGDFVKNSMTIVYDVGLATVYLEDETNFQTVSFQNKVMATLEPENDGTMRMKCHYGPDGPQAFVSYLANPELVFSIARFSEDMEPVPLSLPVGAYISGQLVGKKYKSTLTNGSTR